MSNQETNMREFDDFIVELRKLSEKYKTVSFYTVLLSGVIKKSPEMRNCEQYYSGDISLLEGQVDATTGGGDILCPYTELTNLHTGEKVCREIDDD